MPSARLASPVENRSALKESKRVPMCVGGFQVIAGRFRSSQKKLLNWLGAAHARGGSVSLDEMQILLTRYSPSAEQISYREHELEDFSHERWSDMRLFGGTPSDIRRKTEFFDEAVDSVFDRLYPKEVEPPENIIHVTCTGYSAPSGAQRLVSARQWGNQSQVLHAYHMGCYAAHPALRMVSEKGADIVHTEMCSLHLNLNTREPSQLVIQSLFADGFIKYQVKPLASIPMRSSEKAVLEILATRDLIIPDSANAMAWATGPFVFQMELSKEVPVLLASALPRAVASLFQEAGLDYEREKSAIVFAIHPGGPRIIELSERILGIRPEQTQWSRAVLQNHGNMSSATLPHIWNQIVEDLAISEGTLVMSLGAGPGLTVSGALFRKRL